MKKLKASILILFSLALAFILVACSGSGTVTDSEGNEQVIEFAKIESVEVVNPEILESEGFLLDTFNLSMINVRINYFEDAPIEIPLTSVMIKAESKAALTVAGVHRIYCSYGSKFDFDFVLRLYLATDVYYEVTFYDEDGDSLIGTKLFADGDVAVPPRLPTKEGYTLMGWRNKNTGETVKDFTVRGNVGYVAVFEPDFYEVKYYYTVGETSTLITVESVRRGGNALEVAPIIPIVPGYSNGRWSDENAMMSVGYGNNEFYAVYDSDKVLITFSYYKYVEGEYYDSTVSWNVALATEGVTPPDDAERLGSNVFLYWYVERNGKEIRVDFPYEVVGEIKFVAKYTDYDNGTPSLNYKINEAGTGYTVVGLKEGADDEIIVIPSKRLGLPVTSVKDGAFFNTNVKRFSVSADNAYFRVNDGILYDGALSELIAYPICSNKTSVTVAESVVGIRPYAFKGAKYCREIYLPDGIVSLGEGAFAECRALETIILPSGLETIEKELFMNSNSLKFIQIGNSVKEIKDKAFYGATSLFSVDLPMSVYSIGEEVFVGCLELTSITIDGALTSPSGYTVSTYNGILYGANQERTNDRYYLYAFPSKLNGVGNYSEIVVDSNVRVIKKGAFYHSEIIGIYTDSTDVTLEEESVVCPLLSSLRFSIGKVKLDNNAFGGYVPSKLYLANSTELYIDDIRVNDDQIQMTVLRGEAPSYREFIDGFAFEPTESTDAVIVAYKGSDSILRIPGKLSVFNIVGIKEGVFADNMSITELEIADSVAEIGAGAFRNCANLKSVTLGSGLKSIGDYAFDGCAEGVVYRGNGAALESVGIGAFGSYSEEIADDDGLIVIGGVLVAYIGYSKTVRLNADISIIANEVFKKASYISEIDFSSASSLIKIGDEAFFGCEELASVDLPEGIKSIGERAFYGCTRLFEKNGISETGVATSAFDMTGTDETECFVINKGRLDKYNGQQAVVVIPDGIDKIGEGAFSNNSFVVKVIIGKDISEIGEKAFENCRNLDSVEFSESVLSVKERAFFGCLSLKNVNTVKAVDLNFVSSDAFDGTPWLDYYLDDSVIINGIFYKYNGNLEELHIINSVKIIGDRAFYQNQTLRVVNIPESVQIIGKEAFAESKISAINFATRNVAVSEIRTSAFENCKNLSFFNLGALYNLREIGERAFFGIDSPNGTLNIYISGAVATIGSYAFAESGISTVRFAANSRLEIVEEGTFKGCRKLESVIFEGKSSLYEIKSEAFANCDGLRVFNNTDCKLTSIEAEAFANDYLLGNFKIKDENLVDIGQDAFVNCKFIVDGDDNMIFVGTVLVKYNGVLNDIVYIPVKTTAIANSAFAHNPYIKKIIFVTETGKASNLIEIQDSAFEECIGIEAIEIPYGVEKIGKNAFAGCSSLMSITLGTTIKEIGYGAFSYCESLEYVVLPVSLNAYEGGVFIGSNNLQQIKINNCAKYASVDGVLYSYESVRQYGVTVRKAKLAEYPAGLIEEVNGTLEIPETVLINNIRYTVTGIGDYAFSECVASGLAQIDLHKYITEIGKYAFSSVSAKIVFADDSNIKSVADYTFAGYLGDSFEIPESVTGIGKAAFSSAKNITELKIPSAVERIGGYAFDGMSADIVWANDCVIQAFDDYAFCNYEGAYVIVPETVCEIGRMAFYGITAEIDFRPNLTQIPEYAFYGYAGTKIPVIPSSVTEIGEGAFAYAVNVTEPIRLPMGVKAIGRNAFSKLSAEVIFESGADIKSIDEFAFAEYGGNSISIPENIEDIRSYAFYNCPNLESVIFGGNVQSLKTIGAYAFASSALERIDIPDSVMKIEQRAFDKCLRLTSVSFGQGCMLEAIGRSVFAGCENIEGMAIPFVGASNEYTESSYFGYIFGAATKDENKIFVPSTLKSIEIFGSKLGGTMVLTNAFYGCSKIEKIVIGEMVTRMEDGTLIGCSSLRELTVPYGDALGMLFGAERYTENPDSVPTSLETVTLHSVRRIAENMFYRCNRISIINLPESLEEIGDNAFFGCSRISTVYIGANVAKMGNSVFAQCSGLKNVVVSRANSNYVDDNGVLYEYDSESRKAKLLVYPQKKSGTKFDLSLSIGNIDYEITEIGGYAFYYSQLTDMEIPASVEVIGEYAFAYSQFTSMSLNTANIGKNAFTGSSIRALYIDTINIIVLQHDDLKIFSGISTVYIKSIDEDSVRDTTYIYNNYSKLTTTVSQYVTTVVKLGVEYIVYRKNGINPSSIVSLEVGMSPKKGGGEFAVDGKTVQENGEGYQGESRYLPGMKVTLTAKSNEGYVFAGWFIGENAVSLSEVFEYILPDRNVAVTAQFVSVNDSGAVLTNGDASKAGNRSVVYYLINQSDNYELIFEGNGEIKNISDEISEYISRLNCVRIGSGISAIPDNMFMNYEALSVVSIDEVTEIGSRAFYGCTRLTSINANNVQTVGQMAFAGCEALQNMYLENVEVIETEAFAGTGIEEITLPKSLQILNCNAFSGCDKIKNIEVEKGNSKFVSVDGVVYSYVNEAAVLYLFPKGRIGSYEVPLSIAVNTVDYIVIGIGDYAFAECKNLEYVKLSLNITRIGDRAFVGCSSLTSLSLPNSVTDIGAGAFADSEIGLLVLPNNISNIGQGAFEGAVIHDIYSDGIKYIAIDGILYMYDNTVREAVVVYNCLNAELPLTVIIKGDEYTVVMP